MHTPGPWHSDEMINNMLEFRICNDSDRVIARVQDFTTFREDVEEAEGNARLIAAAPDLLEALDELVGILDIYAALWINNQGEYGDILDSVDNAKAVLAKVKGA